jgi:hypothetical protein
MSLRVVTPVMSLTKEHQVHLGQRLLHALNAGSELLDQDCALAQTRAQRHYRGGGTKAGA